MTEEVLLREDFNANRLRVRLALWTLLSVLAICGGAYEFAQGNVCLGPWFVFLGFLVFAKWWNGLRIVVSYELLACSIRYRLLKSAALFTLPLDQIDDIVHLFKYRGGRCGFAIRTRGQGNLVIEYGLGSTAFELERRLADHLAKPATKGSQGVRSLTGRFPVGHSPSSALPVGMAIVLSVPVTGFCGVMMFVGLHSMTNPQAFGDLSICLWAGLAVLAAWGLFLFYHLWLMPRRTICSFKPASRRPQEPLPRQFSRFRLFFKYANRFQSPYLGFGVLLLLPGLLIFTPAMLMSVDFRHLTLYLVGERAQATITQKQQTRGLRKSSHIYHLDYEFTVAGQQFKGSVQVSQQDWDSAQVGQALNVVFLPSDPQVNRTFAIHSILGASIGVLLISLAVNGGGVSLAALGFRDIRRRVRLIAEGSPALAMIDCLEIVTGRKGRFINIFGYTFQSQEGGATKVRNKRIRWFIPYQVGEINLGDVVLVIYDPKDPDRHEIDRFDARKADRLELLARSSGPSAPQTSP